MEHKLQKLYVKNFCIWFEGLLIVRHDIIRNE